jgi:hypothetical protein
MLMKFSFVCIFAAKLFPKHSTVLASFRDVNYEFLSYLKRSKGERGILKLIQLLELGKGKSSFFCVIFEDRKNFCSMQGCKEGEFIFQLLFGWIPKRGRMEKTSHAKQKYPIKLPVKTTSP